jgi:hypothetical protein
MGSMVVVVDVPDAEGVAALIFGDPAAGVEELFGDDPVVPSSQPIEEGRPDP